MIDSLLLCHIVAGVITADGRAMALLIVVLSIDRGAVLGVISIHISILTRLRLMAAVARACGCGPIDPVRIIDTHLIGGETTCVIAPV
jgi:hypothetical protein